MTRPDLSRLAPPGLALKPEKQLFGWGMALSALFSLQFFTRFADAREKLYWKNGPQRELMEGAVMEDFRALLGPSLAGFLVLAVCLFWFWRGGYFYILDRCVSPDGEKQATVYSRELDGRAFSRKEGTSLIMEREDGAQWRVTYGDCVYRGLWWAPDSQKYVLALEYDDGVYLALAWLERNAESNLNAYLTMGVEATELSKGGYAGEGAWPEINYQFLQWGRDSRSMLIYYTFEDAGGEGHDGYFWYNCVEGTVQAVLELSP